MPFIGIKMEILHKINSIYKKINYKKIDNKEIKYKINKLYDEVKKLKKGQKRFIKNKIYELKRYCKNEI